MTYDVIIIGSGSAGQNAALPLVQAGLSVAMVDEREFGGTCAIRGCQAKKYLVEHRNALVASSDLVSRGIQTPAVSDWAGLIEHKNRFTGSIPGKTRHSMEKAGIHCLDAAAEFSGPTSITLGPSHHPRASESARRAKPQTLQARYIIIATGADPRILPIPGIDLAIDSEDFLNLSQVPKRMITIGAGYIALEFAHILAAQGTQITMIDPLTVPLPQFDSDLSRELISASQDQGIQFIMGRGVQKIEHHESKSGTPSELIVTDSQGDEYSADLVLNAAGRVPRIGILNLDEAGIESNKQGVLIDEFARSQGNNRVYAVGDCAAPAPMLAPLADIQAATAAQHILSRETDTEPPSGLRYNLVPTTVFTHPPLSSIGLTQEQAEETYGSPEDGALIINQGSMEKWVSNIRIGQRHGYYKMIIHRPSGQILGAHILGQHSPDTINLLALAMQFQIPAQDIKHLPRAYPTFSDEIKYML